MRLIDRIKEVDGRKVTFGDAEKLEKILKENIKKDGSFVDPLADFFFDTVLTRYERTQLRKLNSPNKFSYKFRPSFKKELENLLVLGLIDRHPNKGLSTCEKDKSPNNNLHEHFYITEKGKKYLELYYK